MISLTKSSQALAAVRGARSVRLAGYLLAPGEMLQALETAARRGARVVVRLEGHPFEAAPAHGRSGGVLACNRAAVAALRRAGADAALVDRDGTGRALHMKALLCDRVAFLDDRNFVGSPDETIVRDDSARDVRAISAACEGDAAAGRPWFSTTKAGALRAEGELLRGAGRERSVEVETESFSCFSTAYAALKRLARSGVRCRLIVSRRELRGSSRTAVAALRAAGVDVRAADFNEKIAISGSSQAWIGSANATSVYYDGDQIDWGVRTRSRPIVGELRRRFDAQWNRAHPIRAGAYCVVNVPSVTGPHAKLVTLTV